MFNNFSTPLIWTCTCDANVIVFAGYIVESYPNPVKTAYVYVEPSPI